MNKCLRVVTLTIISLCATPSVWALDTFMFTGSANVGSEAHGISFDGAEWHIANFGNGSRVFDVAFVQTRIHALPAGGAIRGLAYHAGRGNVFLGNYNNLEVHETTIAGTLLTTWSTNVPGGMNAIAVNDNDDSLWLVGFLGDVVNVTPSGAFISSFSTPGLNWTGGAYDEIRDTLLLLETGDLLYEYTPAGVQLGLPFATDVVPNNGQGLAYDSITGILHVTSQDGDIAIYSRSGGPPVPTCTLAGPASTAMGDVLLDVDTASVSAMMLDITFEYSTDSGVGWLPCTPSVTSGLAVNPALGVPLGMASFTWDTIADGVGTTALAAGVLARASVDDGVSLVPGECSTAPFDVDNTALCQGLCGDCNLSAASPDVLDALEAARIAAGLTVASMQQMGCCDIDISGVINVLDALGIAQSAAGLPVSLMCP